MATYSTNADLLLDNGKSLSDFMASNMTASQRTKFFDNARMKAYNIINSHTDCQGKSLFIFLMSSRKIVNSAKNPPHPGNKIRPHLYQYHEGWPPE